MNEQLAPTGDVPDVVRRAATLERDDWSAAIDLLCDANRAARSDEIERALVATRQRSFARLADERRAPVPQAGPSPGVGVSGLPEAELSELSAESLRGAIVEHGCVLVPGAIAADRVGELVHGIDKTFEAFDQTHDRSWYRPFNFDRVARELGKKWLTGTRRWVRAGGGVLLCDSPRMMFEVLELYRDIGLYDLVSQYLGGRPVLSANKCTLRRVPVTSNGSWHQDGAFLGSGIRAINVWLPLTPCGLDAPGLDIVPCRFERIVDTGKDDSYFSWAAGDEAVLEASEGVAAVRPQFQAGDALIFDDLLLHRTAITEDMTDERHAIEFWCFAASNYPPDEIPLVW